MFSDHSGMENNNKKNLPYPYKRQKPTTNIIFNDETLYAFFLTRDKKGYSI